MASQHDPRSLAIEEAYQQFLKAKKLEYTDETLRDYETRLRQFVQWADGEDDLESVGDITGWHIEQFKLFRQGQDLAPTTMKGQMATLKRWLDYLVSIDAVDDTLPYKVNIPTLEQQEETDDTMLAPESAEALLDYYRNSRVQYASEEHTALELFWYTGARLGAIYGLDLDDYDSEDQLVEFHHRPDSGLKKKLNGERAVGLPGEVCAVLDTYISEVREPGRDKTGREPLFCTPSGRPSPSTIRNWIYHATIPCVTDPCPHDRDERRCEWTERNKASQCPSSRSPHQIRTGSITWQLNRGLTFEQVGERVNSDPDTLRRYYDKASNREKLEQRRREHLKKLDFEDDDQ
ncbi:MAG: tyrosine-type recombinase/integrase [Halorientalis sp.]